MVIGYWLLVVGYWLLVCWFCWLLARAHLKAWWLKGGSHSFLRAPSCLCVFVAKHLRVSVVENFFTAKTERRKEKAFGDGRLAVGY